MDKFEDTWPALVQQKLKNENCIVINFGVGAWTTMQSLIRCITWFPKIKPDLLIFYHAKNDLTPLVNGNLDEKFIYPDYNFFNGINFFILVEGLKILLNRSGIKSKFQLITKLGI